MDDWAHGYGYLVNRVDIIPRPVENAVNWPSIKQQGDIGTKPKRTAYLIYMSYAATHIASNL